MITGESKPKPLNPGCRSPYEIPKVELRRKRKELTYLSCRSPYEILKWIVVRDGDEEPGCRSPYEILNLAFSILSMIQELPFSL